MHVRRQPLPSYSAVVLLTSETMEVAVKLLTVWWDLMGLSDIEAVMLAAKKSVCMRDKTNYWLWC